MPVPGFLTSFADKAQSAINSSPLGPHLPTAHPNQSSSDASQSASYKSHTLESISNQLRVISYQYSSASPVQKIITAEKSVVLDFDSVSRNSKYQSRELHAWGQTEPEDIKDVTDRLAYLNFVQGSLASSLAQKLNSGRAPFKALREAENALGPRRAARANLYNLIVRLEHDQPKGNEKRIAEMKEQLKKAEQDCETHEKELEILKRKAVKDSETAKWEAIREYGEKLVLLSQAATQVTAVLPVIPPSPTSPYTGSQATAAARAALQRALDNYKTGHINLPAQSRDDLDRSDTRSFTESHATELSYLDDAHSEIVNTPPTTASPLPQTMQSIPDQPNPSPTNPSNLNQTPAPNTSPINPSNLNPNLNQSPAVIPAVSSPAAALDPTKSPSAAPVITPTVAETGIPVSAGPEGPGPATGSLHDPKGPISDAAQKSAQPSPIYGAVPQERHETAEEEKRRLEREERERILAAGGSSPQKDDADDDLPPYQE
jgi:hypothetical protein